jgi:hypothetical protein
MMNETCTLRPPSYSHDDEVLGAGVYLEGEDTSAKVSRLVGVLA